MKELAMVALVALATPALAGVEGKCTGCHGAAGISPSPITPNLAGQKLLYLRTQLRNFKKGTRKDLFMTSIAKSLTLDEINEVSEYFSKLPPAGKVCK